MRPGCSAGTGGVGAGMPEVGGVADLEGKVAEAGAGEQRDAFGDCDVAGAGRSR